jgi:hypothetical protein
MRQLTLVETAHQPWQVEAGWPSRFLDFVIDGVPMYPDMRKRFDGASPLWLGHKPAEASSLESVERLLGVRPGDAPSGRVALYLCGMCGDLGCGAVTVAVRVGDDAVEWSDWSYYYGYDRDDRSDADSRQLVDHLPTMTFARIPYEAALRDATRTIVASTRGTSSRKRPWTRWLGARA